MCSQSVLGMKPVNPRVGVIADTSLQRHILSNAVTGQGYTLAINSEPSLVEEKLLIGDEVDVWLVDLSDEEKWTDFLDTLLDNASAPLLFCDGQAPAKIAPEYPKWERRLVAKLKGVVGIPQVNDNLEELRAQTSEIIAIPSPKEFKMARVAGKAPERVWVLGASLGGPVAVKQFLDCLPPELPVAFVLAQHINDGFLETLGAVLSRDNHFNIVIGGDGTALRYGEVVIAPLEGEIAFTETGIVTSTSKEWDGPYNPSIDQVMNNISERYKAQCGAIIFSGMGNDGSIAGPQMKARGGEVWVQNTESCVVSSQPDSVRETGCVSYIGSPQQLALALVEQVRQEIKKSVV